MTDKRKSAGGSEQQEKKQRDESAAAVPSSAAIRTARAAALAEQARFERKQLGVCSKLAAFLQNDDVRPLEERATLVVELLQEDEKCSQPLLTLSHELDVSCFRHPDLSCMCICSCS